MSDKDQGPTESVLRRIEGFAKDHHDSGYEQGFVDAYNQAQKSLARRSLVWLLAGLLIGGVIAWQVTINTVEGAAEPIEVIDPIKAGATPGLELTNAANFARSYTVGVVAERTNRIGVVAERQSGSGFFYGEEGYVITNYHVVEGANSFSIEWRGRIYPARYVGRDNDGRDIAVLRIATRGIKGAELLPEDEAVKIAEQVIAVGSPLGLDYTVTAGIVSHTSRKLQDRSGINYIQTDCAINKGNSGGPLVNRQGRVVGMNTKIITSTGDSAGIGFAIPVKDIRQVADSLIAQDDGTENDVMGEGTATETAYLGVRVEPARNQGGLIVVEVVPGTPAEAGDLRVDDVIVGVNGVRVYGSRDLANELQLRYKPGDEVTINILRAGGQKNLRLTLGGIEVQRR
ncbi:MAG: trypsin-like peptidase domain-containing protein [Planctomycetes bacterium]|nr:trypsin-like peptidase domain-containing protein [Planctomycetota bacterium]